MKRKLNSTTEVFIGFFILNHIVNIVQTLLALPYVDMPVFIVSESIIMIVVLLGILSLKRAALWAFFVVQFLNFAVLSFMDKDYLSHLIPAVIICLLMCALLLLKKNGISGWNSFFSGSDDKVITPEDSGE